MIFLLLHLKRFFLMSKKTLETNFPLEFPLYKRLYPKENDPLLEPIDNSVIDPDLIFGHIHFEYPLGTNLGEEIVNVIFS